MPDTTYPVWAVAADTLCDGWSPGISTEGNTDYADIYPTRTQAELELADLVRERLTHFIEDPESYDGIDDALNSGFAVVEAAMKNDGTVLIDGEVKGTAPPAIRSALTNQNPTKERNSPC